MRYPAWTRRDFQFVAFLLREAIEALRSVDVSLDDPEAYVIAGRVCADHLRRTNFQFDEDRFLASLRGSED
jgi:hypothetical protein